MTRREPCTKQGFASASIGAACPDCNHTNIVHTTVRSRVVNDECQLCVIETRCAELEALVERYQEIIARLS